VWEVSGSGVMHFLPGRAGEKGEWTSGGMALLFMYDGLSVNMSLMSKLFNNNSNCSSSCSTHVFDNVHFSRPVTLDLQRVN
jgi:hypothetical protein